MDNWSFGRLSKSLKEAPRFLTPWRRAGVAERYAIGRGRVAPGAWPACGHATGASLPAPSTSLIRAYAEIGDVGQALDLLNQTFPETNTLPGKINRWGALRDIALAANRRGEAARAVQIAEQAHDQELRNLVIRAVAMRAVNGGKFAEAEQWARMIDSDRDIQAVLAEISARGALALSGSNQWIVVRRDEEKLRTYPGAFSSAFDP